MIISHQPYLLPAFVDGQFRPMGEGRPAGMHLSTIIRAMMEAAHEKVDSVEGEQEWMRAQIGFLWEAAIEYAWKGYQGVIRPVERNIHLESDGILMSPDGFHRGDLLLEEYKFTWKSMKRWEEDPEGEFWPWMVQTKGYLRALHRTKVRFLVFWAGGSYQWKPGRGPQPTETIFEWTQEELDENWKTVIRYRDFLLKEAADGTSA